MTLIESLWTRSLYFFSPPPTNPRLLNLKHAGAEEGRKEGGRGNTLTFNMWGGKWLRTSSISTIFPFHWGKVLFHSCHFRSFISWGQPRLAVPSPHQHSYQWKWRQHCLQLGGRGVEGGRASRGSVRVYTIKLRWPWGWKHSLKCTLAPVLLPYKHTTQLNKEAPVWLFWFFFFLFLMLVRGWRKRERERERERERGGNTDILSGDPLFMK